MSKKANEFIAAIVPNKANFEYCIEAKKINGSLAVDIEKAIEISEQELQEKAQRALTTILHELRCGRLTFAVPNKEFMSVFNELLKQE